MSSARDKLAKNLPGWLVDHLKEGFASFAADAYREPKNRAEAYAFHKLLSKGYTVLKRGWPDFLVLAGDELLLIEVKGPGDEVRPSQRVVLEALARKGLNVYIYWESVGICEPIGDSPPIRKWVEEWRPSEIVFVDE